MSKPDWDGLTCKVDAKHDPGLLDLKVNSVSFHYPDGTSIGPKRMRMTSANEGEVRWWIRLLEWLQLRARVRTVTYTFEVLPEGHTVKESS